MKTTRMTIENTVAVHRLDAAGQPLGRLATKIADLLRGKGKVSFVHHLDSGDGVIIEHASQVVLTGNKLTQKVYQRHTGYLGHLKTVHAADLMQHKPEEVIRRAVLGMLPRNRLRKAWMKRLTIWAQSEGAHNVS